jgi:predicted RNA-binding protein
MNKDTPKRTLPQNKAIHKYMEMVAHELSNQGQTMQNVIKHINKVEITPTKENVKEIIWKEIQKALYGKKSTTELNTSEVSKVYEVMSMFLSREFGIDLPFPSEEDDENYLKSLDETK